MNKSPTVHLLSGGLDSVTMLYDMVAREMPVHCVLVDYKQQHSQELTFAKHHCHRLSVRFTTLEIPQLRGSKLTDNSGGWVVPNRNAIFLSLAVNVAASIRAEVVTFAANADDAAEFPDCRPAFVAAFNCALAAAEIPVSVQAPYIQLHKWAILDLARQLGVDTGMIWSCYRGGAKPCGECPACKKLQAALG